MTFLLELLWYVNISASCAFLFYIFVVHVLLRGRLRFSIQYRLLRICLVCYLLPFPLIKYMLVQVASPAELILPVNERVYLNEVIHQTTYGFFVLLDFYQKLLLAVWFCALLGVTLYFGGRYLYLRHHYVQNAKVSASPYESVLIEAKQLIRLRCRVRLYVSEKTDASFTLGLWRPSIIMRSGLNPEDARCVMLHELNHIKTHDFMWRVLAMFVIMLHFYNPFVWFLFWELKYVQEFACDEQVCFSFTRKADIIRYRELLFHLSEDANSASDFFPHFRQASMRIKLLDIIHKRRFDIMRKRLDNITHPISGTSSIVTLLFTAILVLCASVPAYAYSPKTIDWRNAPEGVFRPSGSPDDWIEITTESYMPPADEINFQYADSYILMENGDVILNPSLLTPYAAAACSHTYQNVTYKKHQKHSDGSCTVYTYQAKRCTKCDAVVLGERIGTNSWSKCPH